MAKSNLKSGYHKCVVLVRRPEGKPEEIEEISSEKEPVMLTEKEASELNSLTLKNGIHFKKVE